MHKPASLATIGRLRLGLLLLLALGCSGGSSGPNPPPPPPQPPPPPPPPAPVATIAVSPENANLVPQQNVQLTATLRDASGNVLSGRTIAWNSGASTVAAVDGGGLVTGVSPGVATVSASSEGKTSSATVTVKDGALVGPAGGQANGPAGNASVLVPPGALTTTTAIAISSVPAPPDDPMLVPGTAYDFTPSGTLFTQPATINIKYDPLQLRANANQAQLRVARLTANTWAPLPGSTIDIATRVATGQTSSFSVYAVLETPAPVATVIISPDILSLYLGASAQLGVTLRDAANNILTGRTVVWTSSNTTIASVSLAGLVTGIAPGGPVSISATSEGQTGAASVTVQPTLSILTGDQQVGQILQPLPTAPSVKLVDQNGVPRAGVPVTFAASNGGSVQVTSPSTAANGVASPGTWTLGDEPGTQTLTATVGNLTVSFQATGTGTPVYYMATAIALGGFYSCALVSQGTASCWGEGGYLGSGSSMDRSRPTDVSGGRVFTSIAAGYEHSCALTSTGDAYCWGGQGGANTLLPILVQGPSPWQWFSPGSFYNCAINSSQNSYCWGSVANGQLGDGTQEPRATPTLVAGGFAFARIRAAGIHTCALTSDGTAYCWGNNQNGQLGDGTTTTRLTPTAVASVLKFRDISPGGVSTCAITMANQLACWGFGAGPTPSIITGAPSLTAITTGDRDTRCGLASDGSAYCWGQNDYGQLGDGTTINRGFPTPVAGPYRYTAIAAGGSHTCGITTLNGTVACWGRNSNGQLGDGSTINHSTPRRIVTTVIP